ncbi:MAG: DUF6262 family protein [Actinomycetota bacterium]|nr:DUF6262 family protein [Actinomycetota bacterium]
MSKHANMVARRRQDSDQKRRRAWDAFEALRSERQPISPTTVSRRAGVSPDLIYSIPELRAAVEAARNQTTPGAARPSPGDEPAEAPLRARLQHTLGELRDARAELKRAEQVIALGGASAATAAQVEDARQEIGRLQAELVAARDDVDRLNARLDATDADLVAARERARDYLRELTTLRTERTSLHAGGANR